MNLESLNLESLNFESDMKYTYRTQGICSQAIEFEIEDGILKNVQFYGGCNGNTQGVSALVDGMKVDDVLQRLEGIRCDAKLVEVDRRRLVFEVKCFEGETLVGEGIHERFVVDSQKFMSKF